MSIAEIKQLPVPARLAIMEELWDSLCQEENTLESPSWHEEVLNERRISMDSPDAKFLTIGQLRERFH